MFARIRQDLWFIINSTHTLKQRISELDNSKACMINIERTKKRMTEICESIEKTARETIKETRT